MQVTDSGNFQYNTSFFCRRCAYINVIFFTSLSIIQPSGVQFVKVEMAVASFLNTIVCPTLMQLKRKIPELSWRKIPKNCWQYKNTNRLDVRKTLGSTKQHCFSYLGQVRSLLKANGLSHRRHIIGKNVEIIPTNTKHGPREMLVDGHGPVIYPSLCAKVRCNWKGNTKLR